MSLKKIFSKIAPSENTFPWLLPQKYFFKFATLKNTLPKLLPQKIHFKNCSLQSAFSKLIIKKSFFKTVCSKTTFSKIHFWNGSLKKIHFSQNCSLKKYISTIAVSKKTFSELLPQIIKHKFSKSVFQNYSLKKYLTFSKLLSWKIIV